MAYLVCKNLAVGYGNTPVAHGISFQVAAGDMLCIIGENGAGKSTLVKTLLGLVPPLGGSIEFGDGMKSGEVGYLPQQGESQRDFPASAWEIVLSGRLAHLGARPFYRKADRMAAEEALKQVGADDLRDQSFATLSGGQQQRVLLARALCAASKLIVLDEPTTGLDPDASASLYETFGSLQAQGMGIITVSHDVDEALSHATNVLSLGKGAVMFGDASEWTNGGVAR